jgi:hypothetical protein
MYSDFDHRNCPNCGSTMRLTGIEPHRSDGEDGYERHVYRCDTCANVSRFVFEKTPTIAPAALAISSRAKVERRRSRQDGLTSYCQPAIPRMSGRRCAMPL